jgi:hypothetical protein
MIKVRVKIGFEWLYLDITPPWRIYRVFVVFLGKKKTIFSLENIFSDFVFETFFVNYQEKKKLIKSSPYHALNSRMLGYHINSLD